jgi:hypothetical protein
MTAPTLKSMEVYLADGRVFVANIVAQLSAAALMVGVLGSVFTWGEHSALFDLASSSGEISKPGPGYLFGPALIMIALPVVRPRAPHITFKRLYKARLAIAIVLWLIGAILLIAKATGLDGYTIRAGTYVAGTLLATGLIATVAMWPTGLRTGQADRRGGVEV